MRRNICVSAILLFCFCQLAQAEQDAVVGQYWLPDRDGQFEIYRQGDLYFGKVIAYEIADALDENNPDPEKAKLPFVGSTMFANFSYNQNRARWEGGTIYDARSGETYKCRMWFEDDDLAVLSARGYVGSPLFGRTETFARVDQ